MAITQRSITSISTGTTISDTLPAPSGLIAGDLILYLVGIGSTGRTPAIAGFSSVLRFVGTTNSLFLFWKIATASEPSTYALTVTGGTGSRWNAAAIAHYSSIGKRLRIRNLRGGANTSSTNRTWGTVTTKIANELQCCFAVINSANVNSPDAAMTEKWDGGTTFAIYLMVATIPTPTATASRVATGTAATNVVAQTCIVEVDPLAAGSSDSFYNGNPNYVVVWETLHLARTVDIMLTIPVWALIDTGLTGDILDVQLILNANNDPILWCMTEDGIWLSSNIKVDPVTWSKKLDIVTVRADTESYSGGVQEFAGMTTLESTPGFLIVSITPNGLNFNALTGSNDGYLHCYFYKTLDYGTTWLQIDVGNIAHTYASTWQRNYCYATRYGMKGIDDTLYCLRITQRNTLNYRIRLIYSTDKGLTWHEPVTSSQGGLNNFLDGATFVSDIAEGSPVYTISGDVGVTLRCVVVRSDDNFASGAAITTNGDPSVYGGMSGLWSFTRRSGNTDHLIGLFYHNSEARYHILESEDGGDSWTFVWNTLLTERANPGAANLLNGVLSPGPVYPPPINWKPNPNLWLLKRALKSASTDDARPRILLTDDYFQSTIDKSGNIATLISPLTEGIAGALFIPTKPTVNYKVGIGLDLPLSGLTPLSPQPKMEGIRVTRRSHGHNGKLRDEFLYTYWEFNISTVAVYTSLLSQLGLSTSDYNFITVTMPDRSLNWQRWNVEINIPVMDEDMEYSDFFPRNIKFLLKDLEILES